MTVAFVEFVSYLYLLLLCGVGFLVMWRGQGPERLGFMVILIGSLMSAVAAEYGSLWEGGETGIFLVDLAVLGGLVGVLAVSDRFWPLWVTAFQIVAVLTHLARFVSPETVPVAYAIAEQFWAYPMLSLLALASFRARRTRAAMA